MLEYHNLKQQHCQDKNKIKTKFQRQLPELTKKDELPQSIYEIYILLVLKDQECIDYLKFLKRTLHFT